MAVLFYNFPLGGKVTGSNSPTPNSSQNKHHIRPKSRGGGKKDNLVIWNEIFHKNWTFLFRNLIIPEIHKLIEEEFTRYDKKLTTRRLHYLKDKFVNYNFENFNPFRYPNKKVQPGQWEPKIRKSWFFVFGELRELISICLFIEEIHTPNDIWSLKRIRNKRQSIKEYSEEEKMDLWWNEEII